MRAVSVAVLAPALALALAQGALAQGAQARPADGGGEAPPGAREPISLKAAIERGLRLNHGERARTLERELLRLRWRDARESFLLPDLSVSLVTAEHRITRAVNGSRSGAPPRPTSPTGALALNLGDYTLFNWGRDRLRHRNERALFERGMESLDEGRRGLRHRVIEAYFTLTAAAERERARRDQLRHASFVYRFNRERTALGTATSQDYHQSRVEFLRARGLHQRAAAAEREAGEDLARLLGDPPGTGYHVEEALLFREVELGAGLAQSLARERNPAVLEARTLRETAARELRISRRERLPLPRIYLSLGAYSHRFSKDRSHGSFETRPGSSDVDVVATVNATWRLTGDGGILGSRKDREMRVSRALAGRRLEDAIHEGGVRARGLLARAKGLEEQVPVLEERAGNAERYFDVTMDNYLGKRTPFVDFLHALREKGDAAADLALARLDHLRAKVALASVLGTDDLPDRNFEDLARPPAAPDGEGG